MTLRSLVKPLSVLVLATVAIYCSDGNPADPADADQTRGFIVSNAILVSTSASEARGQYAKGEESIVYVSLPPNTLPLARQVQVDNRSRGNSTSLVEIVNGGFDPYPVAAVAGDTLELTPIGPNGADAPVLIKVPPKRPPSIVRTNPPRGRTDVPLSVIVTAVFTEPVNPVTVDTSSFKLLHNGVAVAGDVILEQDSWSITFTPRKPLDRQSTYELSISRGIQDRDGDALETPYSSTFVTGTDACEGVTDETACPLTQSEGTNLLTGIVFERTSAGPVPVANAMVQGWVQFPDGTGYSRGRVITDSDGRYTMGSLPDARVQLLATAGSFDQPCAVVADVSDRNAAANIEVVRPSNEPLPDSLLKTKRLHGSVMEILAPFVGTGVYGARAYFESRPGVVAATATSGGEQATFEMCNLPTFGEQKIYLIKSGMQPLEQAVTLLPGPITAIQFNMTR